MNHVSLELRASNLIGGKTLIRECSRALYGVYGWLDTAPSMHSAFKLAVNLTEVIIRMQVTVSWLWTAVTIEGPIFGSVSKYIRKVNQIKLSQTMSFAFENSANIMKIRASELDRKQRTDCCISRFWGIKAQIGAPFGRRSGTGLRIRLSGKQFESYMIMCQYP